MRTNIIFSLFLMSAVALVSCGDKTKGGAAGSADSLEVAGASALTDDERHTEAYIKERINSIYSHFGYSENGTGPAAEGQPAVNYDSLYCSTRYLELYKAAQAISEREGTIFIDADHWIVGQDVDEKWNYELKEVRNITDSTAQVELTVNNFSPQRVVLDLLFEHGEWYVDNFHQFYDASSYSAEDLEQEDIYPTSVAFSEIDEVNEMREYIRQSAQDRKESAELVGEWGWVGDGVPEVLLELAMDDGLIAVKELTIYRLMGFDAPSASYHQKSLSIDQYLKGGTNIYLLLERDDRGDLTGTCTLRVPEYSIDYQGPITLRKNYFRYR